MGTRGEAGEDNRIREERWNVRAEWGLEEGGSGNVKMWTILNRKMGDVRVKDTEARLERGRKSQRCWGLWEARHSFPHSSPPSPFPISFLIKVKLCLQDMYVYIISWIKAAIWLAHFFYKLFWMWPLTVFSFLLFKTNTGREMTSQVVIISMTH